MTARESLAATAAQLHERLDQVLDSEDAVIVLIDRQGSTSYYHGFGVSGCQLEMAGDEIAAALTNRLARSRPPPGTSTRALEHSAARPATE